MSAEILPMRAPGQRLVNLPAPQQAAIVGNDRRFWLYLADRWGELVIDPDQAARVVRSICRVTSRAEFKPGTEALARWAELYADFDLWKRSLE